MKNESEIWFEELCKQRNWKYECLDKKYPNINTPDYLVSTWKDGDFYAEVKEISNNRTTDKIASTSRVFTLSERRLFGWAADDIKNALKKINSFAKTPFYKPLPFILVAVNVNQAFIDQDINLYNDIFDNFPYSELLSAFGFLKGEINGEIIRYYLTLVYNSKSRFPFLDACLLIGSNTQNNEEPKQ